MIVIAHAVVVVTHRRGHYRLLLARSFNAMPFNKPGSKTGPIVKLTKKKKTNEIRSPMVTNNEQGLTRCNKSAVILMLGNNITTAKVSLRPA